MKKHFSHKPRRSRLPLFAGLFAALFLILLLGCGIYVNDYYHGDQTAQAALESTDTVTVLTGDDLILFAPADTDPAVAFLFYPGGKVEYTAYAPLLHELAENGVLCALLEMPLNLAVLDMDAAAGIPETLSAQYPAVERWYIGGHSLGGSMAASYAASLTAERTETQAAGLTEVPSTDRTESPAASQAVSSASSSFSSYDGLVLLAAYSTADLTDTGMRILSIYGTEDHVLNLEKYEKYRENLPAGVQEILIRGGNHAQFGSYGAQDGDGDAAITAKEQRQLTVESLLGFFRTDTPP